MREIQLPNQVFSQPTLCPDFGGSQHFDLKRIEMNISDV